MKQAASSGNSGLSANAIKDAFDALSQELGRRGAKGEVCLFGGAVMVLAFNARISTKDVDGIFHPTQLIRELADQIREQRGLAKDWLNDAVKGFISSEPPLTAEGLPQFPNLRLTMPVPEYLLAMKCIAGRTAEGATDVDDIIFLIRKLGMQNAKQVLDLVSRYYGKSGIPVRTQYLVEGLFEEGKV